MWYPEEISQFKVKLRYFGRSTQRFTFNQVYEGTYVYGEERGYKATSLDYILLPDGYRLLPWEQKRYFKWIDSINVVLKIMYGRNYGNLIADLVYTNNPFLKMIKKDDSLSGAYFPVPIPQKSSDS